MILSIKVFLFYDGTEDSGILYEGGRHSIGWLKHFKEFPLTFQTLEFSQVNANPIEVRSRDGLVLTLDVSFQYTLSSDGLDILALYMRWENDYASAYEKIARNIIRDVSADFDAFQFFFNRSLIVADTVTAMSSYFVNIGAIINQVQLLNIYLPSTFNAAIQETEITRTKISQASVDRETVIIQAGTDLLAAQKQAEVLIVQANTRAASVTLQKTQEAAVQKQIIEQEMLSLLSIKENLDFSTEELLSYLFIQALQETEAKVTFATAPPPGIAF